MTETTQVQAQSRVVARLRASWQLRLWLLTVVFGLVAIARSVQLGIGFRDPHGGLFVSRVLQSVGILVVLAIADAVRRTPAGTRSVRTVVATVRGRWTRSRLLAVGSTLLAYHLIYLCYRNLKSWDVFNTSRDRGLLEFDRWLFLGHSPAVLLHDLLGVGPAAHVLMTVYASFPTLLAVAVVAPVALCTRVRDGAVGVAAVAIAWILGTISYYAIPSLGPFAVAPKEFASLPHLDAQTTQALYLRQRDYLLAHPHAPDAFAQVSAFASLHVACSTVMMLLARHYRLRITSIVMTVFVGATMIATVYLGWHFVSDVIVGLAIGWVSVRLAKVLIAAR